MIDFLRFKLYLFPFSNGFDFSADLCSVNHHSYCGKFFCTSADRIRFSCLNDHMLTISCFFLCCSLALCSLL